LIGIHFIPSAHDHGMATTTAAGLLMMVGVFDIVGTVASGWLTDRIDPRLLLVAYYTFRGVGLVLLPWLLAATIHPSMVLFIVVYGLDWVATVPPTAVLCRRIFGDQGTIVFGWVFASHQLGAAVAALTAGIIRETFGSYTYAWFGGAALCLIAAALSIALRRPRDLAPTSAADSEHQGNADRKMEAEVASDLTP
jgi:predicted MFS family arabinose efflux permease